MRRSVVVAIDGPAGAGKSTVGERVARELGYFYFDTGVLYRAVALAALWRGLDPGDERAMERLVSELDVRVGPPTVEDGRQVDVLLEGQDVSLAIRSPEVDRIVSAVAASAAVRRGLIEAQRRQVQGTGTVLTGRDIGTVVCPDAEVKVFLDATTGERARRRLRQMNAPSEEFDEVLRGVVARDHLDATRDVAPLVRAADATLIDTEGLSIDEVVGRIVALARSAHKRGTQPSDSRAGGS